MASNIPFDAQKGKNFGQLIKIWVKIYEIWAYLNSNINIIN